MDTSTTRPGRAHPAPRGPEPAGGFRLPATLSPDRRLLKYYALGALLTGPGFPFVFAALWFRYRTLRYDIDEQGITMRWGVLFRREVSLSYDRIQDIHLSSNVVERWLGLARIEVQTASASASAEMKIEGLPNHEEIRAFLYGRMRGAREHGPRADGFGTDGPGASGPGAGGPGADGPGADAPGPHAPLVAADPSLSELADALREVSREVRALRESLPSSSATERGDR